MDKNKIRYCTLLLINDYNHSKIFSSEKNKYYIRDDNKSILIKILNEFEDIRKFCYKINVIDITDNYHKIDKEPRNIKHCTILLIDDDNHSKIFISEKKLCYISFAGNKYDYDDYIHDYDNFYYDDENDDDDYDYYGELVYYNMPLNDFKRLVYDENNIIVNLINNDNYRHNIALLINDFNILICENNN